ncbi:MAG TPA: beta-propeller fold lactonase family protein [Microlunatus sp.]|nr:beta-propeller fold lactonase family protein [Microlunatus sp.]
MAHLVTTPARDTVLVQSNEADRNRLLTFRRDQSSAALVPADPVATAGAGSGVPHLASQGSVTLSSGGDAVFVTNAGSGDVSLLTFTDRGPVLVQVAKTGGMPVSVAERDGLLYVLDSAGASLTGFTWQPDGLQPVPGQRRDWDPHGAPAQVGFSPDGRHLVVTERAADRIVVFPVDTSGALGQPVFHASSGVTPYGFGFTSAGVLVVTEAFGGEAEKSAVSSYVIADGSLTPISATVRNGRTALCWAAVSPNGRTAYAANYGDGTVSRYDISADGALTLTGPAVDVANNQSPGLRDLDLSPDGRHLYAIDADSGHLLGWNVDQSGDLTRSDHLSGLPSTAAGIAAS